jgi:serine protease Do
VPINQAKDFVYQILNTGKFQKPWMGIDVIFPKSLIAPGFSGSQTGPVELYDEFKQRHRVPGKLEVYGVRSSSPADKAGLRKGDVIVDINGQKFDTPENLRLWVFSQDIGQELSFKVIRNGKLLPEPIKVQIGAKRSYDSEFSV